MCMTGASSEGDAVRLWAHSAIYVSLEVQAYAGWSPVHWPQTWRYLHLIPNEHIPLELNSVQVSEGHCLRLHGCCCWPSPIAFASSKLPAQRILGAVRHCVGNTVTHTANCHWFCPPSKETSIQISVQPRPRPVSWSCCSDAIIGVIWAHCTVGLP